MFEKNFCERAKENPPKRVLSRPTVVDDLGCYAQVDGGRC
jgi:hypothetical protein